MARLRARDVRVIIDVISFLLVVVITAVLYVLKLEPFHRGFFCSDETIQYPFHDDTVSSTLVGVLGVIVPGAVIVLLEAIKLWTQTKYSAGKKKWMLDYVLQLTLHISVFLFGAAICMLITEFLKVTVGRLRPNFLDVCQPDYTSFNCSDGYIVNFRCQQSDASKLQDSRKSFPSGHSSAAAYSVTYLVMYLQIRLLRRECRLLRPLIQTTAIIGVLYVLVSRICDNKHHWSDVVSGTLLGVFTAIITVLCISDLWIRRNREMASSFSVTTVEYETDTNCSREVSMDKVHNVEEGRVSDKGK